MEFLSWLTGYSTTTQNLASTNISQQAIVNPISEVFERKLQNERYLDKCSIQELKRLRAYLFKKNVPEEDPKILKITSAIEHKKSILHPFSINFQALERKTGERCEKIKIDIQDHTKLWGFDLSLEEIKKIIDERGDQLTEIVLISAADNELFVKIAEKCVNLTSLRLLDGPAFPGVNTNVAAEIAKLTKLTTLELNYMFFWSSDPKDIRDLLSQPHLQENLTNLNISVFDCGDSVYPPIANYKNLKKLTLDSGYDYNLMPVLQSPSLQKTLNELNFIGVYKITDEVIQTLKGFSQLEHLKMAPTEECEVDKCWLVQPATFQDLLKQNRENLKILTLGKEVTVDAESMKTILTLNHLETLIVDNCKGVQEGYGSFDSLKDMNNLSILTLRHIGEKGEVFGTDEISYLKGLPLKELTLSFYPNNGTTLYAWQLFSHSEVTTKTLKSLTLEGLQSTEIQGEDYGFLGNLPLESLRLIKCGWINDETLKSWIGSPLSKTLKKLEFHNSALTNDAIDLLQNFPELSVLGLVENYGMFGEDAGEKLANSAILKKNLKGLFLGDIKINLDSMLKIVQFDQLKFLITACNTAITKNDNKIIEKACKKDLTYLPDGVEVDGRYESLLQMLKLYKKQSN